MKQLDSKETHVAAYGYAGCISQLYFGEAKNAAVWSCRYDAGSFTGFAFLLV